MIIDESHITVPQIGGMYAGDQSRKSTLVDFGFKICHLLSKFFLNPFDRIVEFDVLTGEVKRSLNFVAIFPASHYVVPQEQKIGRAHV